VKRKQDLLGSFFGVSRWIVIIESKVESLQTVVSYLACTSGKKYLKDTQKIPKVLGAFKVSCRYFFGLFSVILRFRSHKFSEDT
jgi:hypothetical protein